MSSLINRRRGRSVVDGHRNGRHDRLAAASTNSLIGDSSSSDEDEGGYLLQQQKRGNSTAGNKREQTDQEIAAEYSSQKRKKSRPTLTPSLVIGSKGLITIPTDFRSISYPRHSNAVEAAARYSTRLVNAYKSFCHDLFPAMAFEDVVSRIETLGSKREIKDYLTHMREQARNRHLEKIFGKEKAEQMLQELEHGLRQQDYGLPDPETAHEEIQGGVNTAEIEVSTMSLPPVSDDASSPPQASKSGPAGGPIVDDSDDDSIIDWNATSKSTQPSKATSVGAALVDTSDEEEGNEEDDSEGTSDTKSRKNHASLAEQSINEDNIKVSDPKDPILPANDDKATSAMPKISSIGAALVDSSDEEDGNTVLQVEGSPKKANPTVATLEEKATGESNAAAGASSEDPVVAGDNIRPAESTRKETRMSSSTGAALVDGGVEAAELNEKSSGENNANDEEESQTSQDDILLAEDAKAKRTTPVKESTKGTPLHESIQDGAIALADKEGEPTTVGNTTTKEGDTVDE